MRAAAGTQRQVAQPPRGLAPLRAIPPAPAVHGAAPSPASGVAAGAGDSPKAMSGAVLARKG